jgi:hypothetical protein
VALLSAAMPTILAGIPATSAPALTGQEIVQAFLSSRCRPCPGVRLVNAVAYEAFREHSGGAVSHRRFTQSLLALGVGCDIDRDGQRHWRDIELLP